MNISSYPKTGLNQFDNSSFSSVRYDLDQLFVN